MKYVLIALALLSYGWDIVRAVLSSRQAKKPLPPSLAGIYDDEAYAKWRAYTAERKRFRLITGGISTALAVAIFAFDLIPLLFTCFSTWTSKPMQVDWLIMVAFTLVATLIDLVPSYISTFRIEEKYGFNRSTRKTFVGDTIKNLILSTVLNVGLVAVVYLSHDWLGPWMFVGIVGLLTLISVIGSLFSLPLQKIFYRFTPLAEGTLRDRVGELFVSNGYKVRDIYIMNASKRTTRANAFCAGLGRQKKIALFDNLVNNYTEDEIVAVFAHELGHDKHKDTLVLTVMQVGLNAVLAALICGMIFWSPAASVVSSGEVISVAGVIIALSIAVMDSIMTLVRIPFNLVSRAMERRADTFAAQCDLGPALISALKRLSRDNFADLDPHPMLSAMEDSHPTIGERIRVVERAVHSMPARTD